MTPWQKSKMGKVFNFSTFGDIMLTLPVVFFFPFMTLSHLPPKNGICPGNRGYNESLLPEWTWSFTPRVSTLHFLVRNCHCKQGHKNTFSLLYSDLPALHPQLYHKVWSCSQHTVCIKEDEPPSCGCRSTNPNCPAGAYLPPQQLLLFRLLISLHMATVICPRSGDPAVMLASSKHPFSLRKAKALATCLLPWF